MLSFFNRIIDWLEQRRGVNLVLVFAYFVFIYYMHIPVVNLSIVVMNFFSLPLYNKVVMCIFSIIVVLLVSLLGREILREKSQTALKLTYLLLSLAFIVIHFKAMFEMNIECIHLFEYPPLAFLLFPFTRRFGAAVLFTMPFMLLDEWHQYVILFPDYVEYLELNDIMIDLYGCGFLMTALLILGVRAEYPVKPLWKRPEFISLCVMLLAFFIAIKTCILSYYPEGQCANTLLVLDKLKNPEMFWRQYPHRDLIYHVSTPREAVVVIALLCLFYFGLDSFRKNSSGVKA